MSLYCPLVEIAQLSVARQKGLSARASGREWEVRNEKSCKSWAPQSWSSFSCVSVLPLGSLLRLQAWAGRSWVRSRLENW